MARRAVTALAAILLAGATWAYAQQPGVQRKSLLQQDGPPGYQTIINLLEFAPGAREVRHTHPGPLKFLATLVVEKGKPASTPAP